MAQQARSLAQLLKLIANENRLLALCCLLERPMNVGEILQHMGSLSQPALSQHLAALKAGGILEAEKAGQTIIYHIKDERIRTVIGVLKAQYCGADHSQL